MTERTEPAVAPTPGDTFTLYDGSEMTVVERPAGPDEALVMRFVLKHDCGAPPPHVHPYAEETFAVEEGEFEMLVDDEWRLVRAGESVTVEPGRRHTFRNQSGGDVVIRNVHDPHHDFEAYVRSLAKLSHELETTAPNSPGAAARMAMLWDRHDDLIRPADLPLRLGMKGLGTVGRLARLSVPG